jgi:protein TonB
MSSRRKVLLIDYDPESIEATRGPLQDAGYDVEVACDGIAGIEAFDRLHPDLVLIEPMVPKKHGFQVCQEIKSRAEGRQTPVLITTGFYRGRKHRDEAQQNYGCDDYLEKPISRELLLSTCSKFFIDIQEPPIPVTEEPMTPEVPAEAAPLRPSPEGRSSMVDSLPDLPIPGAEKPASLPALDNLTDDEIQERLDAMIIGLERPIADEPTAPEAAMPDPIAPATDPATGGLPSPVEAPEPVASPQPVATNHPPVAPTGATVDSVISRTRREPTPVSRTSKDAVPEEVPQSAISRSRLPLWIGIAAVSCILAGVAILWMIRGQGEDGGSAEMAALSTADAGPEPSRSPVRPRPDVFPTVPVLEEQQGSEPSAPEATPVEAGASTAAVNNDTPAARPRPRVESASPAESSPPVEQPRSSSASTRSAERAPVVAGAPEPAPARVQETVSRPEPKPEATAVPVAAAAGSDEPTRPASAANEPADQKPEATQPVSSDASPSSTPEVAPPVVSTTEAEAETTAGVAPAKPAQPTTRRGDLVDASEVDRQPVAVRKPMPDYPPAAMSRRLEGTVHLMLLVDEEGRVAQVEIASGTKIKQLQRAAVEAAHRWVYEPGVKDGVPVKVWVEALVDFKL